MRQDATDDESLPQLHTECQQATDLHTLHGIGSTLAVPSDCTAVGAHNIRPSTPFRLPLPVPICSRLRHFVCISDGPSRDC